MRVKSDLKAVPHLWQRYPQTARVVVVVLLALPAVMMGTVLYQEDYDPWTIVGVAVAFWAAARWILERPERKH